MHISTLSSLALLIAKALSHDGHDVRSLFERAGLDINKLRDPNARYPVASMFRLWEIAAQETQDPCFGLRAADQWHPTTMHALGYSWLASATLRDAFERTVRYIRIITNVAEARLEESQADVKFTVITINNQTPPDGPIEAFFAILVKMCRMTYGEHFSPLRVYLQRRKPGRVEEFSHYFQAPVRFSAPENSLCLDKISLNTPLSTANAELARANDQVITEYLAHLDRNNITMQVKAKLIELLPSGNVSEESIAKLIHVSHRSMQRKLKEAGTTYRDLLDETRCELASQYVQNSQLSISEISFLLGFSSLGNFSRAFKRWTGMSPSTYRLSAMRPI